MSDSCNNNCSFTSKEHLTPRYKTILWIVLIINAGMFLVEMIAGVKGQSVSLMADAVDFLSDAGNYVITLIVLGMSLRHRAIAALVKGLSMGAVGLWVLGSLAYYALQGTVPSVPIMSTVAFLPVIIASPSLHYLIFLCQGLKIGTSTLTQNVLMLQLTLVQATIRGR